MPVVLFPHQLNDLRGLLRQAHQSRKSTILVDSFLEKAYAAIRDEACVLPRAARAQFPVFDSLFDLSERSHSSSYPKVDVSSALVCACHLAHFIGHYQQRGKKFTCAQADLILAGVGIGQLSAAAVACSGSLSDLVDVAVFTVRLAFRTGTIVGEVSQQLDTEEVSDKAWSMSVSGAAREVQLELQTVQDHLVVPGSARPYLSAVCHNTCVVSGRPSRLQQLKGNSALFQNLQCQDIPSEGLWHATHLYSKSDVSQVLEPFLDALSDTPPPCRAALSPATGKAIEARNAKALFTHAINDILRACVQWDLLEEAILGVYKEDTVELNHMLCFETSQRTLSPVSAANLQAGKQIAFQDLAGWCSSSNLRPQGQQKSTNIAVVGMSCRFPSADDTEALWKLLEQGQDTCKRVPKDRFDIETHYDPTGKRTNTSHTPYGCFIDQPGLFDPRFFNMSPREATETDPMHRLALVTAYEALEMSGFVLNSTPSTQQDRVGTFYGQTCDDWREVNGAQNIGTYFIPGGARAFAPGRINYYFGFCGPSYSIDTACSSSLAAIQLACQTLITRGCDTAVTGGVNVLTAPDIFAGLSKGQFLSKTGSCKTWDITADGYCRADGVGSIVLKREEDALADKDNILGILVASGTNHSADATSITHPHAGNQACLYESVLHEAGIDPLDVSYVEMHGTGTQAGDLSEMESVTKVFAPMGSRFRCSKQALHIGAVKSNSGHGEAAAGIAALIKVLLMLQKSAIPPHVGIKTKLNPKIVDLQLRNVQIPFEKTSWQQFDGRPRFAFVNNFSAAGGNTALLLRDPPQREALTGTDPRSVLPFVISAKSPSSLQKNIRELLSYLESASVISCSSLSYTLTSRRMHHTYRVGVAASDTDSLRTSLLAKLKEGNFAPISAKAPRVAFVFTGQGSFYPSLGRHLFELSVLFRSEILHLNKLAMTQGLPSFLSAIEGSLDDEHQLSTLVTQLALVCVQMALVKLWQSWGVRPAVVIGHSLGEYPALYTAGVLSRDDVIHLVGHRARLLEERCTADHHLMLLVKASTAEIENVNGETPYEIACINTPCETVICGSVQDMEKSAQKMQLAGYKCLIMDLPYAFHSAHIDPILNEFEKLAGGAVFNKPKVPVISPLLCQAVETDGIFNPEYFARHAREPVNFASAVQAATDTGIFDNKTAFIEIGAHAVCNFMIKASIESFALGVPSLHKAEDSWKTLSKSLCSLYSTGLSLDWHQFHREYDPYHDLLDLPAYSFDNKNYWIDYVNDWCLYRNEPRDAHLAEEAEPRRNVPKLSTSSLHRVVFEEFNLQTGKVVAQSDLADPAFRAAILGHRVNSAGICPSSIYADMAMTLGDYVHKQVMPESTEISVNCGNMEVVKPLIVREPSKGDQILQVTMMADFNMHTAHVRYASINAQGSETLLHATCLVTFEDRDAWMADWASTAYLIHGRIEKLDERLTDDDTDRISRGLAYKMFSALVQYEKTYQGMENVILDSANFEATSRVSFQTDEKDGTFFCNPYWIDSLAHLGGFVLNGNDAVDSKEMCYISHGWKSMRIARSLVRTTKYRSYVKMQSSSNTIMAGDVYILEGNVVIGVVGGLKFQRISRAMLNTLLPPEGSEPTNGRQQCTRYPTLLSPKGSEHINSRQQCITSPTLLLPKGSEPIDSHQQCTRFHATSTNRRSDTHRPLPSKLPLAQFHPRRDIVASAVDIIAQETGLVLSELQDECAFADLGVDSLLALQISGKFREMLDIDVPSSIFVDNETIGLLKVFLKGYDLEAPLSTVSSPYSPYKLDEDGNNGYSSDTSHSSTSSFRAIQLSGMTKASSQSYPRTKETKATIMLFRTTIADQMGIGLEEVVGSNDFRSLGLDSLMALVILGILRERTGFDLSPDLFIDYPSIDAIQYYLDDLGGLKPTPNEDFGLALKKKPGIEPPCTTLPQAVSILMQGNPKNATKILFLLPDGSGSATSYAHIPAIDPQLAVYGLNCPFMTSPGEFTNGIHGVASLYLAEIRRRQPFGPYHLGGWSAGGVISYEITQQMLSAGERVDTLLLIDSLCPIELEPLPSHLHHFFAEIGLLGSEGQEPPSWLIPHFQASVKALTAYVSAPIKDKALAPRTLAIWARHGVCRYPHDPRPKLSGNDPRSMKWLLENRTDFRFNGWDALLGQNVIETASLNGNHFSLMKEPEQLLKLSRLIKDFL